MTGFGRSSRSGQWGSLTFELKTVNHRYLEPYFKLPHALKEHEFSLREKIKKHLSRGKIEVFCQFEAAPQASMKLNESVISAWVDAARTIHQKYDLRMVSVSDVLRQPDAFLHDDSFAGDMKKAVFEAFEEALLQLHGMRQQEGEKMKQILQGHVSAIESLRLNIVDKQQNYVTKKQEMLKKLIEETCEKIDNDRLEQELVHMAQRLDIQEEVDRLQAHLEAVSEAMARKEPIGRRLDFLMQELNREVNTIASKSQDGDISKQAIEMKVIIEKMREQIQNVE